MHPVVQSLIVLAVTSVVIVTVCWWFATITERGAQRALKRKERQEDRQAEARRTADIPRASVVKSA